MSLLPWLALGPMLLGVGAFVFQGYGRHFYAAAIAAVSALGYDAYMLILDAITRAGKAEPAAIAKALGETKGFQGVTGATTINETHDAEKPVGLVVIKDGKKVYEGEITPEL